MNPQRRMKEVMLLASHYWKKSVYRRKLQHWQICVKYAWEQFAKGVRLKAKRDPVYIELDPYHTRDLLSIRSKNHKFQHRQKKRNIASYMQSTLLGTRVERYQRA